MSPKRLVGLPPARAVPDALRQLPVECSSCRDTFAILTSPRLLESFTTHTMREQRGSRHSDSLRPACASAGSPHGSAQSPLPEHRARVHGPRSRRYWSAASKVRLELSATTRFPENGVILHQACVCSSSLRLLSPPPDAPSTPILALR